jgi:hypothetical protein
MLIGRLLFLNTPKMLKRLIPGRARESEPLELAPTCVKFPTSIERRSRSSLLLCQSFQVNASSSLEAFMVNDAYSHIHVAVTVL